MKTFFLHAAKFTVALGVILGAGWAILTFSARPDGTVEVQEAEADIWGLEFGEKSKHERFIQTLQAVGMEHPRAYDWNGNRVFFSTMTTSESPKAVLRKFQGEFARTGVNKKAHNELPDNFSFESIQDINSQPPHLQKKSKKELEAYLDWQDDLWSGGVVPIVDRADMVQMIGTTTIKGADSSFGAVKEIMKSATRRPDRNIKAMRYIDAMREKDGSTRVTSVWSDNELKMGKFNDDEEFVDRVHSSTTVPACMGCKRLMRFEGVSAEKGYVANIYEGTTDPKGTLDFYDTALKNRGWQPTDSTLVMQEARKMGMIPPDVGEMNIYARGSQFITVTAQPAANGKTHVEVMEVP